MDNQLTKELKENYNIVFHDLNLLEQAFTHSSYVNEHRNLQLSDNERLEFLGDAVLELMVSQYLFRLYPHLPEGKLTKHELRSFAKTACRNLPKNVTLINMFCWAREKRIQEDVRDQHCFATYSKLFRRVIS